jgi:hypothetical protein
VARRAPRAGRPDRKQARRERDQQERAERDQAKREQDDDVLAHDELARERLAFDAEPGSPGLLRRLAVRSGSGGVQSSVFVEIFAPTRYEADLMLEAQRLVGAPAPAPSDPPFLEPVGAEANSDRYRGRVVIRKPAE